MKQIKPIFILKVMAIIWMLITKIINWIWHSHQCSLSRQVSSSRVVEGMPGIPGVMGNNKHERVHFKWLEEDDQEQYRQTKHWRHYWVLSNEEYINIKCTKISYLSSLNISAARMKFKLNSRMTPTIQMNFQSDLEFARQFWTCSGCADGDLAKEVVGYRDTQQHVLISSAQVIIWESSKQF